ncbi:MULTISPECIES: DUF4062 domain-containing protein [unclassified Acinetobacter]|uniref:DUF4062 domain-containing protein n=1 Tax=unclassified Acinetobacter TaxID=196816 RepID=UPI0035B7D7FF
MSEKRYFIYISTACHEDLRSERLKLENTLIQSGILPWEFKERRTSLNTALARRQIDDCDYIIFLLGGKYGDLSASGISYMQLDFLYALNKQKTIISFVDAYPEKRDPAERENNPELIKKFQTFRDQLKNESHYVHLFTSQLDLANQSRPLITKALKGSPATGWVRAQPNDVLHNEIQRLRQKIAQLEQQNHSRERTASTSTPPADKVDNQNTPKGERFTVSYRTQAFQDGNLQDLQLQRHMTWLQILQVLAPHFKEATSEINFQRVLNHFLESTALNDAQRTLPRAHAVSRTQIDSRALQQIKLQMKWNNWIVPQHDMDSSMRINWQLTAEGHKILGN